MASTLVALTHWDCWKGGNNGFMRYNKKLCHEGILLPICYFQHVRDYDDGDIVPRANRTSRDRMYGFSSITISDIIEDLSIIVPALIIVGYILMIIYCGTAFFKCDLLQSRSGAGLVSDRVSVKYNV